MLATLLQVTRLHHNDGPVSPVSSPAAATRRMHKKGLCCRAEPDCSWCDVCQQAPDQSSSMGAALEGPLVLSACTHFGSLHRPRTAPAQSWRPLDRGRTRARWQQPARLLLAPRVKTRLLIPSGCHYITGSCSSPCMADLATTLIQHQSGPPGSHWAAGQRRGQPLSAAPPPRWLHSRWQPALLCAGLPTSLLAQLLCLQHLHPVPGLSTSCQYLLQAVCSMRTRGITPAVVMCDQACNGVLPGKHAPQDRIQAAAAQRLRSKGRLRQATVTTETEHAWHGLVACRR